MKYRKWILEQKRAIAKNFYLNNRNWHQTTREANISDGLLRYWLAGEDINPDELLRENKDLRKKIAYLEDKVAYLTELYKVISEEPEKILKKTVHRAQETCPNWIQEYKTTMHNSRSFSKVSLCTSEGPLQTKRFQMNQ